MLEAVAENIWIAEGDTVNFYGFAYPTRSVIVRLQNDDLWIWSPIALSPKLKIEIEKLGKPKHLVSPNKIHHLFLQEWKLAFPNADLWGPLSTIEKRSDLEFQPALKNASPECWNGDLDQVWFQGSPVMDEIVFFHQGSRTVIIADLSENFGEEFLQANWKPWQRWIARRWRIVEGEGRAPLEWRLSFFGRKIARIARDQVLAWNPERVIMAHGEWQRTGGKQFLERSFSWL